MSEAGRRVRFLRGTGVDGRLYGVGEIAYLPEHVAWRLLAGGRVVEVDPPVDVRDPVPEPGVRVESRDPIVRRRRR